MNVLKFGGTSVGSAERMKALSNLIQTVKGKKIVVLSAMSGTTNNLVEISKSLYNKNTEEATQLINKLENNYNNVVNELFSSAEYKTKGEDLVKNHFSFLKSFTLDH